MDNAQKAIMIGVGLFITIIIISAVMLITSAGQDLMDQSMGEVGDISENLSSQLTSRYDETTLTGSQVIAAVKSYYTSDKMILAVSNGAGYLKNYGKITRKEFEGSTYYLDNGTTYLKSIQDNPNINRIGKLSDKSDSESYVAPAEKYKAHLIKYNDAVIGIYFKVQN